MVREGMEKHAANGYQANYVQRLGWLYLVRSLPLSAPLPL